jgi:hypothetical protein
MHPFNYRSVAEDLVRVRRPDERGRYAAAQRQARIDPDPHQIDAELARLRQLGVIKRVTGTYRYYHNPSS